MGIMKKTVIAVIFTVAGAGLFAAEVVESIVVRVGDRVVTRTQYLKRMRDGYSEIDQTVPAAQQAEKKEELKKGLLNDVISELLLKDRADRLGLRVSDPEIKEAVLHLKQQYGISDDKQFDESLQKSGMTRADMEARLRDTLLTNKVFSRELRNRDDLSDRELRERYDREKERYRLPERARLREIIILKPDDPSLAERARKHADEVAAQARLTPDFGKLASTASEASTREKGGDLGEVARGELLPDLDKAVFNASAGAVLGPIATRSGWHILRVEQRLPSEVPAFESVKDRLRKDASDETFQRDYKAYIDRLRKDAFIQINESNIPAV
jgi:parvulin-like peptidyl-prolyl isomerase